MYKKTGKSKVMEKEKHAMSVAANSERPRTISGSIMQSCKEIKDMREGRIPKRSLNDLFANIEKWKLPVLYYYYTQVWKICQFLFRNVHRTSAQKLLFTPTPSASPRLPICFFASF